MRDSREGNEDSKSRVFQSDSCRSGDEQLSDSGRTAVHRVVGQLSADGQTAVCLRTKRYLANFSYRFAFLEGAIYSKMKGWKVEKKPLFLYKYAEEYPQLYIYTGFTGISPNQELTYCKWNEGIFYIWEAPSPVKKVGLLFCNSSKREGRGRKEPVSAIFHSLSQNTSPRFV